MIGKINICLVGVGGIGSRWIKALNKIDALNLVAVVDPDTNRAKQAKNLYKGQNDCKAFTSHKDLLPRSDIHGAIVATPHKFLANITTDFLKAGKHVLSEKPCGIASAEIVKILEIIKSKKLCYMPGFNHRFHEAFILARKLFKEDQIGKIQFIRSRYGFGGRPAMQHEWRFKKDIAGGGELIDQGAHMIDMIRSFMGEIKDIKGFAENLYWKGEVDDNAFVLLKDFNDRIASVHVSWSNWNPIHNFEIYGTKGYITIDGLGRKYGKGERVILGVRDDEYSWEPKEKIFECNSDADLSLVHEAEEFVDAIREDRESIPNGRDALQVLKIVENIYGSQ